MSFRNKTISVSMGSSSIFKELNDIAASVNSVKDSMLTTLYLKGMTGTLDSLRSRSHIRDLQNLSRIPHAIVETPYATKSNFTGSVLYHTNTLYARREVTDALTRAAADLAQKGYGIRLWDAYRPLHVQSHMFELVPDPRYVSIPTKDSARHCRGTAIDLTLYRLDDPEKNPLNMGTPFDSFQETAFFNHFDAPEHGPDLRTNAEKAIAENRALLRDAMHQQGFIVIDTEWWHYDFQGWQTKDQSGDYKFPVLDVPIQLVPYFQVGVNG